MEKTNIIKGRFLRDGEPTGREYSYLTAADQSVAVGEVFTVDTARGEAQLVCTAVNVPEKEIESFRDKMKCVKALAVKGVVDSDTELFKQPESEV